MKPKLRKQEIIDKHEAWLLLNKKPEDMTTNEYKKLNRWLYGEPIIIKNSFIVK